MKDITQNIKAGITVSLVSIPLSISLAIASGASPIVGIVTAIWAGLFASVFGGSLYNVVGPTGALSALLFTFALTYGAQYLPLLSVFVGVIILIGYFARAELYLKYFPALAIQGFTLGVAFMIAFNQMTAAMGIMNIEKHEFFLNNLNALIGAMSQFSLLNFSVFLFVLLGLFACVKFFPKIPGAIVFSVVGILLGLASKSGTLPFQLFTLSDKYADLTFSLALPFHFTFNSGMVTAALTISVVAILETMISAKIADGMTGTKHNPRKEMLGLSLANIASGLFGGMPATAALARTSLNIKSGATEKSSSLINGISVLFVSYFFFSFFKFLPLAVIAAILVFTAIRMIEVKHLGKLYRFSRKEFILTLLVAAVCIVEDSIVGLLFGAVLGLLLFVYRHSHGHHHVVINSKPGFKHRAIRYSGYTEALAAELQHDGTVVYAIKGSLAYINGQEHLNAIEKLSDKYKKIIIRLRDVTIIDIDGLEVFDEIISILHEKHVDYYLSGVVGPVGRMLHKSTQFAELEAQKRVYPKTSDVLTKLGHIV